MSKCFIKAIALAYSCLLLANELRPCQGQKAAKRRPLAGAPGSLGLQLLGPSHCRRLAASAGRQAKMCPASPGLGINQSWQPAKDSLKAFAWVCAFPGMRRVPACKVRCSAWPTVPFLASPYAGHKPSLACTPGLKETGSSIPTL